MDKYTAGKIEGMLVASRKFIEIATSGVKKFELLRNVGHALADLMDVSREIYAEHPKLNPFLEMEKATAEWRAMQRKKAPQGEDPFGGMEFVAGAWRQRKKPPKKRKRSRLGRPR